MDDPGRISVIIPTYNRGDELKRAIKSVLSQTYKNYELIVVDDGSTDNTSRILSRFTDKIRFYSKLHGGVSSARNFGLEKSEGTWVAFLDSDDYWLPEKLDRQMQYIREHPDIMIVQTDEKWIRKGKFVNPMKKHQKYSGWIFPRCLPLCIVSPSAVLVHQKVFNDVGVFDENLPVCEDYDLWLRIAYKYQIALIPEKLIVKTGGHSDQLSRQYWGMDRYRIQALEKLLKEDITDDQRELVLKEIIKKLTVLETGRRKRYDLPNIFAGKLSEYRKKLDAVHGTGRSDHSPNK
ncbi:MAG: glycosyltransferase [Candidatus Marinimicrobia bacterium]|nr:glycosyltransferase [Candidatus Neomarinimicrobiota bacterium]